MSHLDAHQPSDPRPSAALWVALATIAGLALALLLAVHLWNGPLS